MHNEPDPIVSVWGTSEYTALDLIYLGFSEKSQNFTSSNISVHAVKSLVSGVDIFQNGLTCQSWFTSG